MKLLKVCCGFILLLTKTHVTAQFKIQTRSLIQVERLDAFRLQMMRLSIRIHNYNTR